MPIKVDGNGPITGVNNLGPVDFSPNRNKLINSNFCINQLAKSGTVTLTAGQEGHDGFKGGAGGCTYTFATTGIDTVITITAGTLVQTIPGEKIYGGIYTLSWTGTAQGRVGLSGAYAASPVSASGLVGNVTQNVEWGTGTLGLVQFENAAAATPYARKNRDEHRFDAEYFYQTSYDGDAPSTTGAATGRITFLSSSTSAYAELKIYFTRSMFVIPTMVIYNPTTGAASGMRNETLGTDFGATIVGTPNVHRRGATFQASTAPAASHTMSAHFTAAARAA